jgi:hypothetical protein
VLALLGPNGAGGGERRAPGVRLDRRGPPREGDAAMSEIIYNRIAMLRAERGISRRELADALGVHYQAAAGWSATDLRFNVNLS